MIVVTHHHPQRIFAPSLRDLMKMVPPPPVLPPTPHPLPLSSSASVAAVAQQNHRQPLRADHALRRGSASASGLFAAPGFIGAASPLTPQQLLEPPPPPPPLRRQLHRPVGIATNPRVRRHSRDAVTGYDLVTTPFSTLQRTPTVYLSATAERASQVTTLTPTAAAATAKTRGRRWRTPTGWASEKLARLRRSLSASFAADTTATRQQTPTLHGSSGVGGGIDSGGRITRRRQVSIQRLVHRLAQSPVAWTGRQTRSGNGGRTGAGRVLRCHPDGSRTLRLRRPPNAKFGFFLARGPDGVTYVSRFANSNAQSWYSGLLSVGDSVELISGLRADTVSLEEIGAHFADKSALEMRIRSGCQGGFQ